MPDEQQQFGGGLSGILGPQYTPADPNASPLDRSANLLQQRIQRADEIATAGGLRGIMAQIFLPTQKSPKL